MTSLVQGKGFFKSTTARLTAILVLAQLATLGLGLFFMHSFTQRTIVADARIAAEVARDDLVRNFRSAGPRSLIASIQARIASHDDGRFVVLLVGSDGTRVVGNLTTWPATIGGNEHWRMIRLFRSGATTSEEMGLIATTLPHGYRLLTGQVLEAEGQLTRAMEEALFYALLLGVAISSLVGLLVSRLLEQRIDAFSDAALKLAQGRLDARVERNQTGDAFDRLGTSINAMLARIEGLVRELRMVTDSLAHDLRSPVSRMKAALERGVTQTRDPSALTALGGAIEEADGLHRMLNTALQISRAEAGVGRDQFTRFNLSDAMADMAEVYGPLAEDAGFEISLSCPAMMPVLAHRDLMNQSMTNLIDNALKYAHGGNHIILGGSQIGDTVCLSVTDNGPGIPSEQLPEARRRFGRLDPARTQAGGGLGMSLVETVARLHGGSMIVDAADPRGLRVMLQMPIGVQALVSAPEAERRKPAN